MNDKYIPKAIMVILWEEYIKTGLYQGSPFIEIPKSEHCYDCTPEDNVAIAFSFLREQLENIFGSDEK